ncbi:hypothetical protein EVAR_40808_1 [Eumeta japonica]|uniref:Uncharacterized protein n=1 Tax=Eumeta variegata TaxID=151549 RepID=A0A4C1X2J1_EUMVA|nr:hypothetical protein EVAR_40808_1 [Eumeta japonica]
MSKFDPSKRHLQELLIYFNLKKIAAEAHRLLDPGRHIMRPAWVHRVLDLTEEEGISTVSVRAYLVLTIISFLLSVVTDKYGLSIVSEGFEAGRAVPVDYSPAIASLISLAFGTPTPSEAAERQYLGTPARRRRHPARYCSSLWLASSHPI